MCFSCDELRTVGLFCTSFFEVPHVIKRTRGRRRRHVMRKWCVAASARCLHLRLMKRDGSWHWLKGKAVLDATRGFALRSVTLILVRGDELLAKYAKSWLICSRRLERNQRRTRLRDGSVEPHQVVGGVELDELCGVGCVGRSASARNKICI